MFSIHRQTFDRWVQYRKLPLIRIGNRKWIKGDDLNRWLGEHSTHQIITLYPFAITYSDKGEFSVLNPTVKCLTVD